jgi:hypothetical protein
MDEEVSATATEPKVPNRREQSTIQFPYGDLNDGISVCTGLMACGGVAADPDQLAAAMKQKPTSGNFRLKIATARMFGLIETIQGKYQLTDLGFAIVDPDRTKSARADAFLNVPLYRKVYDEFRNKQLPPRPVALEHAFVQFGVASKQKDRARQAFDRSAQQSGYFDHGSRDRLIRPPVGSFDGSAPPAENNPPPPPVHDQTKTREQRGAGSGGTGGGRGTPDASAMLLELLDPAEMTDEETQAVWTLLLYVKRPKKNMPDPVRDLVG